VTRDVLVRKLGRLQTYLGDLKRHAGKSAGEIRADPYEIERLLELLVQVSVDLVTHELAERGIVPETYRQAFLLGGEQGLLPDDLAEALADAAGLRNVLVHLYEDIDYEIVAASVGRAIQDFTRFLEIQTGRLVAEGDPTD
jgi:uncharacterized protein YutE (UPF0331/DUF86 family)